MYPSHTSYTIMLFILCHHHQRLSNHVRSTTFFIPIYFGPNPKIALTCIYPVDFHSDLLRPFLFEGLSICIKKISSLVLVVALLDMSKQSSNALSINLSPIDVSLTAHECSLYSLSLLVLKYALSIVKKRFKPW